MMNSENKIVTALNQTHQTLSIAESCTGGLIANKITNVPGSSQCLLLGIVAYSNQAKIDLLDVAPQLIKKVGAVSEEVAIAMAKGIRKRYNTNYAIGITGIAGPSGATATKPAGLVYIAIETENETLCHQCVFTGPRIQVKRKAANHALKLLTEFLL